MPQTSFTDFFIYLIDIQKSKLIYVSHQLLLRKSIELMATYLFIFQITTNFNNSILIISDNLLSTLKDNVFFKAI